MLTLETLPHQIRSGEVHTVVVAFPDLQGRPVGKRVTGSFFLDHVADHGIEVCDYLLAATSTWSRSPATSSPTGRPATATSTPSSTRTPSGPCPGIPGRVLVLCDLLTRTASPSRCRPAGSCAASSSAPPNTGSWSSAPPSSSSTCSSTRSPRRGPSAGRLAPHADLDRGLPAAPDLAGGVRHRPHPQPDGRGGHPGRVLQGRGRHRAARDQHHLRRPRSRWPTATWCSRTG